VILQHSVALLCRIGGRMLPRVIARCWTSTAEEPWDNPQVAANAGRNLTSPRAGLRLRNSVPLGRGVELRRGGSRWKREGTPPRLFLFSQRAGSSPSQENCQVRKNRQGCPRAPGEEEIDKRRGTTTTRRPQRRILLISLLFSSCSLCRRGSLSLRWV